MSAKIEKKYSRRNFIRLMGVTAGVAAIGACAPAPAPTTAAVPTTAPAAPTDVPAAPAAAAPATSGKKFKVGYSCCSWTIPWQVVYKQMFEEEMKKYPNIEIIWHDANFENKAMVDAMEGWISQKVDMILDFPLDHVAMIETYKKAMAAGIPVLLTMDPPAYPAREVVTGHSGLNGWDGSRECAELLHAAMGGQGKIGYVTAPQGSSSEMLYTEGFVVTLQRLKSGIEIVATEDGNWDVDTSYKKASDILTKFPKLDAFYTTDDYMGGGIIRALKEKGYQPGQVKMICQGASKQGISDMKDGWYIAIVDQGPELCAPQDAWFVHALLEEGRVIPHDAMVLQQLITKDNMDTFNPTW
jgi:ABC-type sugar transport system substrate-binding protein